MLNDSIVGLLPATEDQIVAAFPRVSQDAVLKRLRRLEKGVEGSIGIIKKRRDGKYILAKRPKDGPLEQPKNSAHKKQKTCGACGKTYTGIAENFGSRKNTVCTKCREKLGPTRVCKACGERKPVTEFRRRYSGGKFVFAPKCHTCRGF